MWHRQSRASGMLPGCQPGGQQPGHRGPRRRERPHSINATLYRKLSYNILKGGGPALAAVVAGETAVYFTPIATGLPHIRSGKLRPLGVATGKRLPELPDVPAVAETLPGCETLAWAGLMVPAKTSQAIIDSPHKAAASALNNPDVAKRLNDLGYLVVGNRPEELAAYVKSELEKYAKLIRQIGLPPQ